MWGIARKNIMQVSDLQSLTGGRRKGIAAIIVVLLLAVTVFALMPGGVDLWMGGRQIADHQACNQHYRSATRLLSPAMATNILALPGQLPPYIKSISNKRYWGLSNNLQLKAISEAPTPYVLELSIPRGAINPGNKLAPRGGAGYHWTPDIPADTRTVCLSYSIWFPKDFDFVKGGKLPGVFGGTGPSGGKKVTGQNGFSTRFMWRRDGDGEVYAYIVGNDRRGISIDRGAWRFARGKWIRLEQEVFLNSPGAKDGRVRVWVDGQLVIDKSGLVYRTTPDVTILGVMAHVFFGGKDPSWASTKDTFVRMTPFDLYWQKEQPLQVLSSRMVQQKMRLHGSGH